MSCVHCENMKLEVERLKRELGDIVDLTDEAAVRKRFRLAPMESRLLMRLYTAKGAVLSRVILEQDVLGHQDWTDALKVHISRLRAKVGRDALETVQFRGYRLSPVGRALIYQTIHPREVAA